MIWLTFAAGKVSEPMTRLLCYDFIDLIWFDLIVLALWRIRHQKEVSPVTCKLRGRDNATLALPLHCVRVNYGSGCFSRARPFECRIRRQSVCWIRRRCCWKGVIAVNAIGTFACCKLATTTTQRMLSVGSNAKNALQWEAHQRLINRPVEPLVCYCCRRAQ